VASIKVQIRVKRFFCLLNYKPWTLSNENLEMLPFLVAQRLLEQLLDAVAIVYGLSHGLLATRLYAVDGLFFSLVFMLALTFVAQLRFEKEKIVTLALVTVVLQRYVIYALAYAMRVRVGALFGTQEPSIHVLASPLIVIVIVSAIATQLSSLVPAQVTRPLALVERFVEAIAFTYGLADATRAHFINACLVLFSILVLCTLGRESLLTVTSTSTSTSTSLRTTLRSSIEFIEQYAVYIMTRLLYTMPLVRDSVPHARLRFQVTPLFFMVLLCALLELFSRVNVISSASIGSNGSNAPSRYDLTGSVLRRLVERFLDALAVVAALAHAQTMAMEPSKPFVQLATLLIGAHGVTVFLTAASRETLFGATVKRLAALVTRYATYVLVQLALMRMQALTVAQALATVGSRPTLLESALLLEETLLPVLVAIVLLAALHTCAGKLAKLEEARESIIRGSTFVQKPLINLPLEEEETFSDGAASDGDGIDSDIEQEQEQEQDDIDIEPVLLGHE
jgi:hypothetical protein